MVRRRLVAGLLAFAGGCSASGAAQNDSPDGSVGDVGDAATDGVLLGPDGDAALLFEVESPDAPATDSSDLTDSAEVADGCTTCPVTASGTACGVMVTILPFYARKTGGFQSGASTGTSSAISINFASVVQKVTVTVHDANAGNQMVAYFGKGVAATVVFDATPVGGASTKTISSSSITRVVLQPATGDFVWYDGLSFSVCK